MASVYVALVFHIFYAKVNSYPEVTFVVVSVCQQRQVCTKQTVQKVGDSTVPFAFRQWWCPTVAVFGQVGDTPVVVNDRCLEVPHSCGYDVAVITQRQVWVSRTVDVPQVQFIAPFDNIPVAQQRLVHTVQAVQGASCGWLRGCDEVFLLQFCSIFRPPSIRTLRPRWQGRREFHSQAHTNKTTNQPTNKPSSPPTYHHPPPPTSPPQKIVSPKPQNASRNER